MKKYIKRQRFLILAAFWHLCQISSLLKYYWKIEFAFLFPKTDLTLGCVAGVQCTKVKTLCSLHIFYNESFQNCCYFFQYKREKFSVLLNLGLFSDGYIFMICIELSSVTLMKILDRIAVFWIFLRLECFMQNL